MHVICGMLCSLEHIIDDELVSLFVLVSLFLPAAKG